MRSGISGWFNELTVAWNDVSGYLEIPPKFRKRRPPSLSRKFFLLSTTIFSFLLPTNRNKRRYICKSSNIQVCKNRTVIPPRGKL